MADAAADADGLAGIGVLEPGTPLRFAHPIVRTAVHEDIPQAGRGLRHAEAARLLAAEGADLDVVCAHLLVCEPAGSAEVVERLRAAAARAVGRGAPESAVTYLRRAMAETADVGLRARLAQELGRAEKVLGDPAAAGHLREALRLSGDPAARAAVAPDLAEALLLAGQWKAGTAVLRDALAELADRDMPSGEPSPGTADELGRRNTTVAPWREQRDPQARLSSDIRRAAGGAPPGVTAHRGVWDPRWPDRHNQAISGSWTTA